MSNNDNTIIPDDIITTINDFKRSKNGSMISIHGKDYATVPHRVAVVRRNLGAKLQILTEIISIDKDTGNISVITDYSSVGITDLGAPDP